MKVDCIIDEKRVIMDVNSNISLAKLIKKIYMTKESSFCDCRNFSCMSCLVFIDDINSGKKYSGGILYPSCLFPSFRLGGKRITTKKYFYNSADANDVLAAINQCQIEPCSNCSENKIMIISAVADEVLKRTKNENFDRKRVIESKVLQVLKSYSYLSSCNCLSLSQMKQLALKTIDIRFQRIKEWKA